MTQYHHPNVQLNLFEDATSPGILRTQMTNALLEVRLDDAAHSLAALRAAGHPEVTALDAALQTLAALHAPSSHDLPSAIRGVNLMERLTAQIAALAGLNGQSLLRREWSRLAARFALLPFSPNDFRANPGWMHLEAGDPQQAWDTLATMDVCTAPQPAVHALARAGYGCAGALRGWSALCWHAWRWPQSTRALIDALDDQALHDLARTFHRENEQDLPMDWFPAWAITQEPDLGVILRREARAQEAHMRTPAQRGAVAAYQLVLAERAGVCALEQRRHLKHLNAWLFAQYLQRMPGARSP